eukprot:c13607_g2_i1 orf=222-494(+)
MYSEHIPHERRTDEMRIEKQPNSQPDLFHFGLSEEHMLLDNRIVFTKLQLMGDFPRVLALDEEEPSACSRHQPHQQRSTLGLPHLSLSLS